MLQLLALPLFPRPDPAHSPHTWMPCRFAGGLALQRCSEPSADWPGPAGKGVISTGKGRGRPLCLLDSHGKRGGVDTHLGKRCHNHVFSMSVGRRDIRKGGQGNVPRIPSFQLLPRLCPQRSTSGFHGSFRCPTGPWAPLTQLFPGTHHSPSDQSLTLSLSLK